ncbi:CDK5 regulatory subunit-associated protein 3 [Megalopta genalis]|uniref:CDK5 regulatory subunit-associated protein 3 n=1 Tax=Megalopta genalis TaxID=115081 RepID=UPI001442E67F|nr:CDK5 regulatory subunit-associated protein 3 [Megalopta genalis]
MEEQNFSIIIDTRKLLEWLISRRHCNKDWHTKVLVIREKINNAIQDMPEHDDIAKLLSGTYINYFHCLKIVEILKETEADTKNVFGRYGSQRMKDWQEIVKAYEKDNLYLAEIAQMLIRNVIYEVPSSKKQIQKLEQMQTDFEKKEAEYKKLENAAQSEFDAFCKQLCIDGHHIKQELAEKVKELPEIYEKIAKESKSVQKAIEFYCAFVNYTLGRLHDDGCVPMLKYVIEKGNTTTYEWIYGEPPLSINEPPLNINTDNDDLESKKAEETETEIDFGDIDLNADIDWGGDINLQDGAEIDWGEGNAEVDAPADGIDFNISLEESGIVVEAAGLEGGVASGTEAYTVLDNPSTRSDFINQLYELEAFLILRLHELKADDGVNFLSFSQIHDSILQYSNVKNTQNMLESVEAVLSQMLNPVVQHLHNIKHSPSYIDKFSTTLKHKQSLVDKMIAMQHTMKQKRQTAAKEVAALQPLLQCIIQRTKELQEKIEQDISKKYKNRDVQLTGILNQSPW